MRSKKIAELETKIKTLELQVEHWKKYYEEYRVKLEQTEKLFDLLAMRKTYNPHRMRMGGQSKNG